MPDRKSTGRTRSPWRRAALARRDNAAAAGPGRHVDAGAVPPDISLDVPPLTNSELVQLQIRVIALENVVMALLSDASEPLLELARERAVYIAPRPGHTPHRLTIHAAARIVGLIEDAAHYRELPSSVRAGIAADDAGDGREREEPS